MLKRLCSKTYVINILRRVLPRRITTPANAGRLESELVHSYNKELIGMILKETLSRLYESFNMDPPPDITADIAFLTVRNPFEPIVEKSEKILNHS